MSLEEKHVVDMIKKAMFLRDGQYRVGCTWKPNQPTLPDNHSFALKHLHSLERGKLRDPVLRERYAAVIQEWLNKDYGEEVAEESWKSEKGLFWAHFPVMREDKTTTKICIIMDGAGCLQGHCISDALSPGRNLIANLQAVLVRMRVKLVTCTGDV